MMAASIFRSSPRERRLRAAKKAGLETAPCMVDSAEDQLSLELALIENLQREDLNPIEEARGYDRLKREFSLTQDKIAEVTGKARSSVANSMRLLNLPTSIPLQPMNLLNYLSELTLFLNVS